MTRQWSLVLQFVVFAILVSSSVGLWLNRAEVNSAFAALRAQDDQASATTRDRRGAEARGVPVIVTRAVSKTNRETLTAVGTGRARRAVTILPKADGDITSLRVAAGDRVAEGDVLFTIDDTQARLALDLAQKRLADAKRLNERSSYLQSRRVTSGAQVEDTRSALQQAELEVRRAEETLGDLQATAPFAGVVGIPSVDVGDRVTVSTAVVTLDDRSVLDVEFDVPERFLSQLQVGDRLIARTPSYVDRAFDGTIAAIDSRVDPTTRSVTVRAAIPNDEDTLRPGMSFAVEVVFEGDDHPAVPELALQWRGADSYVWRVIDGTAQRTDVTAIRRLDQMVLLKGAVTEGDLVVVEGVQRLRPGRAVSFEQPTAARSATGAAETARNETSGLKRPAVRRE